MTVLFPLENSNHLVKLQESTSPRPHRKIQKYVFFKVKNIPA